MPLRECPRVLSKRWKDLPQSEKQTLKEQYRLEHAKWRMRVTEWKSEQTAEGLKQFYTLRCKRKRDLKTTRRAAKPPRPTRPTAVFFKFLAGHLGDPRNHDEGRATIPYRSRLKIAGARWKELSEAEKAPFLAQFAKETKEYLERAAEWDAAFGEKV